MHCKSTGTFADEGEDTKLTHRDGDDRLNHKGADAILTAKIGDTKDGRGTYIIVPCNLHGGGLLLALAWTPTRP